jgi:hypothetical protein
MEDEDEKKNFSSQYADELPITNYGELNALTTRIPLHAGR